MIFNGKRVTMTTIPNKQVEDLEDRVEVLEEEGPETAEGAVLYTEQTLTFAQKRQARDNIEAVDKDTFQQCVDRLEDDVSRAVGTHEQFWTDAEKAQARENIGALAESELSEAVDDALAHAKASGEFDGEDGYTPVKGKDYFDGYTPVKGIDYFTEADKVEMVTAVMEAIGCPVFGLVDENNNIVLSGTLPDGTYSVKYEMENGSTLSIGNMVLDTNVYYSVTNTLTNCTTNNSATKAVQGGSYSATITAKSGYELSSVKVTMGGTDISSTAVSGGKITIANVTGNIVITAVAEEIQIEPVEPTNFAVPNATNKTDWSIWCNDARFGSDGGYRELTGNAVTNYIPFQFGDVIYIKGMTIATTGTSMNNGLATYGSDKTKKTASYIGWYVDQNYLTVTSDESTPYIIDTTNLSGLANASGAEYFRLSGVVSGTLEEVVINIKRNGAWL